MKTRRSFTKHLTRPMLAFALALCLSVIVAFQNCGRFETDPRFMNQTDSSSVISTIGLTSGGSSLQPNTDRTDTNCLNNSAFDACLFNKNPVAQKGSALSGTPGVGESLEPYQTYGVRLTGLDDSGKLQNDTIVVATAYGTDVSTNVNSLRVSAMNDGSEAFTQVSTYYWLNRTREYIEGRTGLFPAKGHKILVVVDDTVAGWSPRTNSIHLRVTDAGQKMAWDPDLAIHFLGLANLHYATAGAIRNLSSTLHRDCGTSFMGCCTSKVGCARAISSGVGDYFVGMMFPDKPTLGETWTNRTSGLAMCGLSRDLGSASALTAQAAFDSCGASGGSGDAASMGTVYASIWWTVRQAAIAEKGDSGAAEIDTLFMQHLSVLTGADNFSTAMTKIKSLDSRLFNGHYSPLFDTQAQARGL